MHDHWHPPLAFLFYLADPAKPGVALIVKCYAFNHKKDFLKCLGDKHPNSFTGSRVTVILKNEWISLISGALVVKGLRSMGLPRLVYRLFE